MSIWKTLSAVDVSDHIEKKGNLSYLSWAWAWGVLMEKYPESEYEFAEPIYYSDGTCEVWVSVTISEKTRKMWLPVMDYRNKSIPNPTSRDISDARMRCLVKCLAMFGLGHYIYAGEDLPEIKGETTGEKLDANKIKKAHDYFKTEIDADNDDFDYAKIQSAWARLSGDEGIAVMNMFGKEKCGTRQYKNVLNDCLKQPLDGQGKPIFEDLSNE